MQNADRTAVFSQNNRPTATFTRSAGRDGRRALIPDTWFHPGSTRLQSLHLVPPWINLLQSLVSAGEPAVRKREASRHALRQCYRRKANGPGAAAFLLPVPIQ